MKNKSLLMLIVWSLSNIVLAKDFGKQGTTFDVKEEGFLAMIYRKLKSVNLEKEQGKMQQLARQRVEEPLPVEGLKRTEKEQSFTYDPTYILAEDVILPDGKLLYPAGTRVNPFDHVSLEKKLIFIDSRDLDQVEWFKQQEAKQVIREEDKLILVAGRPLDLGKELNREVYFDQAGVLTAKFRIEQVPAIVSQEGKVLRIREIKIN